MRYFLAVALLMIALAECAVGEGLIKSKLVQKIYKIGDLLDPDDPAPNDHYLNLNWVRTKRPLNEPTKEQRLIQLIKTEVAKDCWNNTGGLGTIEYSSGDKTLIIRQKEEDHEEIKDLLAALRRLSLPRILMEVRLLEVPKSLIQKLNSTWTKDERSTFPPKLHAPIFDLTPKEFAVVTPLSLEGQQLKDFLELVHGDLVNRPIHPLRPTIFNGESTQLKRSGHSFYCKDLEVASATGQDKLLTHKSQTCFALDLTTIISADGQFVRTVFHVPESEMQPRVLRFARSPGPLLRIVDLVGEKIAGCARLNIPCDRTVIIQCAERSGGGADSICVLLTLTPRIIREEDEGELYIGQIPPIPRP